MNEQLQAELAKLVGMLNEGAEEVAKFGAEQIPIVLQQLLLWHSVESLICFVTGISMIVFYFAFVRVVILRKAVPDPNNSGLYVRTNFRAGDGSLKGADVAFASFMLGFVAIIGFVIAFNNLDWLKIWLAPNLYLLEYAAGLVK